MKLVSIMKSLAMVGVAVFVISAFYLSEGEVTATMTGFVLFSLNILVMAYLAGVAMKSVKGEGQEISKLLIAGLGLGKFMLLAGGLYLSLIHFKFSGIYLGAGALVALSVVLWCYTTHYLKSLSPANS